MNNKKGEFLNRVDEIKPDIIGITEVWQKEEICVQGYQLAGWKARPDESRGGGVLLMVKDHFQVSECEELNSFNFDESVWCIIHTSPARRLLVGVCYRPPGSSHENNQDLLKLMDAIKTSHATDYLIMGDFNFREINWMDGTVDGPGDSDAAQFYEKVQDCYLCQHVTIHTRFREGTLPSTLDLIFTDQENNVDELKCSAPLGKSDHCVITWELRTASQKQRESREPPFNYRAGNYETMREELSSVDWEVMEGMNIDDAWIYFREKLHCCRSRHVPRYKMRRKQKHSPPWWNKVLERKVKQKYRAYTAYRHHQTQDNYV